MRLGKFVQQAAFLPRRVRYLGDGMVHPVGVVDPGQVGLVQPLSQHLNNKERAHGWDY